MQCKKCDKYLPENMKFCNECGTQVPKEEKKDITIKNKKTHHWFFWWKVEEEELKNQVENYSTLKITHSARGQSVLCLLFSIVLTFLCISFGWLGADNSSYFDIIIFVILAFFIYRGHKWAMIGAMILWTFEKGYQIFDYFQNQASSNSNGAFILYLAILWWAFYMSAFWLAFQTEIKIKKIKT